MEALATILHVAVLVCFFGFVVSFCVMFYAGMLVYSRTWKPGDRAKDLSWGERAWRASRGFNDFLVADEFRSLRRLYFGGWAGVIGSFGLLLLLALLLKRT
jgi:hypothetical protein